MMSRKNLASELDGSEMEHWNKEEQEREDSSLL